MTVFQVLSWMKLIVAPRASTGSTYFGKAWKTKVKVCKDPVTPEGRLLKPKVMVVKSLDCHTIDIFFPEFLLISNVLRRRKTNRV